MSRIIDRFPWSAVGVTILLLAAFTVSCGNHEATEATEAREPTPPPATPERAHALTDANIAAIVVAANTIDIKNAEMAGSKTGNQAVKAFATQMIADHTSVNAKTIALMKKLAVSPEDDATSRALVKSADSIRAGISTRDGADFDKAFIDNELAHHRAFIEMLDGMLVPRATNPKLTALLVEARPVFKAHLDHAKHLQAALAR